MSDFVEVQKLRNKYRWRAESFKDLPKGKKPSTEGPFGLLHCSSTASKIYLLNKDEVKTLEIGRLLGTGGFGSVYEGRFKGKKVAIKKLHLNTKNPHAVTESFLAESSTMTLRHRNIIRLIAVSPPNVNRNERYIIMEYAGSRNLRKLIDDETEKFTEFRRMGYALDIANALNFIHRHKIVHLDLKPANIIVTCQDVCKLGDFGCSKILPDDGLCSPATPTNSFLTGTFAYRAPELLKGDFPSSKADMYSYGICLWQLLTRERPYGSENLYVVIFGVVAYNLRPKINTTMREQNQLYIQLIEDLWQANAVDRPSASEVLRLLRSRKRKRTMSLHPRSWRA